MSAPQSPWPPYPSTRDCSLGFCSIYCPQFCYFFLPPPPPPHSHSPFSLSPLLISVITLLSTSFLILAAYIITLKYLTHRRRLRRHLPSPSTPSIHLPPPPSGLSPSIIHKLTTYLHRSGTTDSDCPVCLAEFRDGETVRLLPKCAHAFHRICIDTWLNSHSNCPLCRAGILLPAENLTAGSETAESEMARDSMEEGSGVDEVAIDIVEEREELGMAAAAESSAGRSPVKGSVSSGGGSGGVAPL